MAPTFAGLRRFPIVAFGRQPVVGDVVVARRPDRPDVRVVKRVTDRDARGWWLESDASVPESGLLADSWVFGPVSDEHMLGVVVWPKVRRPRP